MFGKACKLLRSTFMRVTGFTPHESWCERAGWLSELCWQLSAVDRTLRMIKHPLGLIRMNVRALCGFEYVSSCVRQVLCQRLSSEETSSLIQR